MNGEEISRLAYQFQSLPHMPQASTAIQIAGGQIRDGVGKFEYLVEACDPCEDNSYAYTINGIAVSDFITPHFYDPMVTAGTRYSFTGAVKAPRQILPGGYISWVNTVQDEWQQLLWVDPSKKPYIQNIGPADPSKSLREWIDTLPSTLEFYRQVRKKKSAQAKAILKYSEKRIKDLDKVAVAKAKLYA